jgi:VanZ family protein
VKLALRLGAFIFGAFGSVALVGTLENTFPWIWLPLLLGVAISTVVSFQPWFKSSRLATPFCVALMFGTTLTYSLSITPVISRAGAAFPKLAEAIGLALFAGSLGLFLIRGLAQRKTAKMSIWLIVPIAAGCVLGYVSGGIGGGDHMVAFAMNVLHMTKDQADVIVHYLRKTIHFTAYGFVGLSFFRGAIAGTAPKARAIGFALICILCLASFDEMRQTTAPNRTGSPWDVTLDMCGASFFVLISAALSRKTPTSKRVQA